MPGRGEDRRKKPLLGTGRVMSLFLWLVRLSPLGAAGWVWFRYGHILREMTLEDILAYEPENLVLASVGLLTLYAVKSVTVVFPLILLYAASGILFDPVWAISVNLLGLVLVVSIPYGLGAFYGRTYVEGILAKREKIGILREIQGKSGLFISYFTRVVGILPGDLVSMLLGALHIGYGKYLAGSLLGLAPVMLAATFWGAAVTDPASPGFWISGVITVTLSAGSAVLYLVYRKKAGI